jgi:ribosomal protein L37E
MNNLGGRWMSRWIIHSRINTEQKVFYSRINGWMSNDKMRKHEWSKKKVEAREVG